MKMEAANTYKSNWKGRDASEVTMRAQQISQQNNKSTHKGPSSECCTDNTKPIRRPSSPTSGFSTDFTMDSVTNRPAGGMHCNDSNWGSAGGVTLKTCAEISTILYVAPNPGSTSCECADPGVPFHQIYPPQTLQPYTGWRNHVPANLNPSTTLQAVTFPSG